MNTKRFSTGQRFRWNNVFFEVKRLTPSGQLNIENLETGAITTVPQDDLITALFTGLLTFETSGDNRLPSQSLPSDTHLALSELPKQEQKRIRFRYEAIEPLLKLTIDNVPHKIVAQRVAEVKEKHHIERGISVRSVYRWLKIYSAANDIRALGSNYHRSGGKGRSRLKPELLALIDSVIKDFYYRPEKVSLDALYQILAARIDDENRLRPASEHLSFPDRSTIYRRIKTLNMEAQFTRKRRLKSDSSQQVGRMDYPKLPLDRVEIDHTLIDLVAVDEEYFKPIGRPTLTFCIDMATRYPLGYYLGFEPPSYLTVLECLYNAILPKTDTKERFKTQGQWQAYGIPNTLIVDNGKEFIGRDLEDACLSLGITLIYAPFKTPEYKGGVERGFGTLNTNILHQLPGTTFSNIIARGDYDSVKQASLTCDEIERIINLFIVDMYANNFHRGLQNAPAQQWNSLIQAGFSPRLPSSEADLRIVLGRTTTRKIGKQGISLERLRYNCPQLAPLRARLNGVEVKIKYHPGDLSRIHVFNPFERRYIEVPALDTEYTTNLSLWKHRVIRQYIKKRNDIDTTISLGNTRLEIDAIANQAQQRQKRTSTGKKIARWNSKSASATKDEVNSPPLKISGSANEYPDIPVDSLNDTDGDDWELTYVEK